MDDFPITTIARQCRDDDPGKTFTYSAITFKQLLIWDKFDGLLSKFVPAILLFQYFIVFTILEINQTAKNSGFYWKRVPVDGTSHLVLYHSNERVRIANFNDINAKCDLIEAFFVHVDGSELELERKIVNKDMRELPLNEFYEKLKQVHESDDLETGIPQDVQHSYLKPLLREYQKKGVKWMLSKELRTEKVERHYIGIRSKFDSGKELFLDTLSYRILTQKPIDEFVPSGGLLTGEK